MESVRRGVLMTVTSDPTWDGRDAGEMAAHLLNGADPRTLPVTRSDHFLVGINLTTADRMDIVVPSDILDLARENLVR